MSDLGLELIIPFWRMVDSNSNLAKKLECGVDFRMEQRNYTKLNPSLQFVLPNPTTAPHP